MSEIRLQKVLAAAGIASRRASEKLISAGRVRVDGEIVTELGTRVDPERVEIRVDGKVVGAPRRHVYFKLHKPKWMLSDIGGESRGRETVADLLPPNSPRVFPVGRLDFKSEGLMLLTDDGPLANRLTHPRYEHPKTYYVLVSKVPGEEALMRLRNGIELESGRTRPATVEIVGGLPPDLRLASGERRGVWLRFVLREGKKRQIRHMIGAVDVQLERLVRWSIGPLTLAGLSSREVSPLSRREIAALKQSVVKNSTKGRRRP